MEWRIKFHKSARKFTENLDEKRRRNLLERLEKLRTGLEEGVIPFRNLDVRKLKGVWEGFFRVRVGEIRVIFKIDVTERVIWIYNIHYRGKIY